ncbi:protein disulfide-isomerase A3-like [Arctopsyche grandis]|uniref:protein disulfide-isomerase A3-like n=1 Tax=Arctopsyche grandis TaxID=121162 RepID=UPI00406D700C
MQHSFLWMMATAAVVALTVVAATEEDVLDLTDADFTSGVTETDTTLVMFYAPWCGHCKRLKPEYAKAAELLKANDPPIALAKVDCTEGGKDTCGKYSVSGYPTLKIFRNGEVSQDYGGPREASGIVKYMRAQVGPSSKDLKSLKDFEDFIAKDEVAVVGFFEKETDLKGSFLKLADKLREKVRFAHSSLPEVLKAGDQTNGIVLFRPKLMSNKFEDDKVVYSGSDDSIDINKFITQNFHGLVGYRTRDSAPDFKKPLVIAFYSVDYVKNPKGTNYWRNRILKVAKEYSDEFTFAISSKDDFTHELNEFGLDYVKGDKPVVCAYNDVDQKFIMEKEFSVENFQDFLSQLKNGDLDSYVKSEPIPESNDAPVKVAVGKNFEEIVTKNGKDTLIEFYAPWCGHCKKLTPIYDELGEKMKDEDIAIVKMDASSNDVPPPFKVHGFPTIYWASKDDKKNPITYEGGREVDDFVKYIAKQATDELKGYDRKGSPKKTEL